MHKIVYVEIGYDGLGHYVLFGRGSAKVYRSMSYKSIKRLEKALSCCGVGGIRPQIEFFSVGMSASYHLY